MAKSVENLAKEFLKERAPYSDRMVPWVITWGVGVVKEKDLWPVLRMAFPYEVTVDKGFYRRYERIGKWIDENSTGRWTHSGVCYFFELEIDATACKLRWS